MPKQNVQIRMYNALLYRSMEKVNRDITDLALTHTYTQARIRTGRRIYDIKRNLLYVLIIRALHCKNRITIFSLVWK